MPRFLAANAKPNESLTNGSREGFSQQLKHASPPFHEQPQTPQKFLPKPRHCVEKDALCRVKYILTFKNSFTNLTPLLTPFGETQ